MTRTSTRLRLGGATFVRLNRDSSISQRQRHILVSASVCSRLNGALSISRTRGRSDVDACGTAKCWTGGRMLFRA